ncbi:MAG: hypothetical protein OEN23_01650 [Paracoccaceae bacterium]|nr:hypothetical protein [Paracoccaceae bacterium]
MLVGGAALVLIWPAISLAMVALAYGTARPGLFCKNRPGIGARIVRGLLLPYTIGASANAWAWLRGRDASSMIVPGLRIGGIPAAPGGARVIDLCAEIPRSGAQAPGRFLPMLDLVVPEPPDLIRAARAIEAEHRAVPGGDVLVCCALGYGRSAAVAATWLVVYGHVDAVQAAVTLIRIRRPGTAIGQREVAAIARAVQLCAARDPSRGSGD